jgi:hypothetical protein
VHAQRAHALAAAGQHLVRIALVADVPDQAVFRRVEDGVQGDGQFDGAEVGRQVAAGLRDRVDQEGAQFGRQLRQLLAVQSAQVGRAVDGFKQGVGMLISELPVADEVGQLVQAGARSPKMVRASRASARSSSA